MSATDTAVPKRVSVPLQDESTGDAAVTRFDFDTPGFSDAVRGEWFGYECAFDVRTGAPECLEERYVPDEFAAWGVEIKGFEIVTSSICELEGSERALFVKRTRALPSVGCEADAVTPEVRTETVCAVGEDSVAGGFSCGSYSVGPTSFSQEVGARWSACLANPDDRRRVRVEFGLVNEPRGAVTVFVEEHDGDYCEGQILPGCGGKNRSFADDAAIKAGEELAGEWRVEKAAYERVAGGWLREQTSGFMRTRSAEDAEAEVHVAMPRGITVGMRALIDGGMDFIAGWLISPDKRTVVRRSYNSSGTLASVSRETETRQLQY